MIELLLESLMLIARWDVAIALLIGAIGGVIIGAIPGVGPAVAIAILLSSVPNSSISHDKPTCGTTNCRV